MSKKVYASFGHTGEANWIEGLGFQPVNNIDVADVVVFGGGKDVDPGFYGEKRGSNTDSPSNRDKQERLDFLRVQELRKEGKLIKTVGVCRGAQLACALSGGRVIQHVTNHFGSHDMSTFDKCDIKINSIHHQMMYPYELKKDDYKILGWSREQLSSGYTNGFGKPYWLPNNFKETEVVLFKNTDSLAVQWHPEMLYNRGENNNLALKWLSEIFTKFYNNEI